MSRSRAAATGSQRTSRRGMFVVLAGVLAAATACSVTSVFLSWLVIPTETAGHTEVSGIGSVSGDTQLAGQNLNDVLTGLGSFRPGWTMLAIGIAVFLIGVVASIARPRRTAALRATGGMLALMAILGSWWSIHRMIDADPASLLGNGAGGAGAGQILALVGMVLTLLAALVLLLGLLDDQAQEESTHRGIQPGR